MVSHFWSALPFSAAFALSAWLLPLELPQPMRLEVASTALESADIDTCAELAAILTDETGTCGGVVLSVSPTLVTPQINDTNGNELVLFTTTASAVNEFTITNGAAGTGPTLSATGGDTNINIRLTPKGTGTVLVPDGSGGIPGIGFLGETTTGFRRNASQSIQTILGGISRYLFTATGLQLASNGLAVLWRNGPTRLFSDANHHLDQRNGVNVQVYDLNARYVAETDQNYLRLAHATVTLSSVSGASVTASSLIPDGAVVVGLSTQVTTALGTGNGTTGYQVGDGTDADRWGTVTGTAAGTETDNVQWTTTTIQLFTSAQDVVITAVGGNFDGTGAIFIDVSYLIGLSD